LRDIAHNAVKETYEAYEADGFIDTDYRTQDYIVAIGYPDITAENEGRLFYCVVNISTGVIEYSTAILPQAVLNMNGIQASFDEHCKVPAMTPEDGVYQ
jgi:hypothetical protein